MKRKFKVDNTRIRIRSKTRDKLKVLSEASNKDMIVFLQELVDNVFDVGGIFQSLNVAYESDSDTLVLRFSGRSRVISGMFSSNASDEEVDKEIKRRAEEIFNMRMERDKSEK